MMFLRLLQEGHASLRRIALMAIIGGFTNGVILAVINLAADAAEDQHTSPMLLVAFLAAVGVVTISQTALVRLMAREVEGIIFSVRADIVARLRGSDVLAVEAIGRGVLYNVISSEAQVISRNIPTIVNGAQAALLVVFTILYLVWLSPLAMSLVVLMTAIQTVAYFRRTKRRRINLDAAYRLERVVVERLVDVLDGFKELKLNGLRALQLQAHFEDAAREATDAKIRSQVDIGDEFIFGRSLFYLILAAVIFVAPVFSETVGDNAAKVTAAVLFMMAPVSAVLLAIPMLDMVNIAAAHLRELQSQMGSRAPDEEPVKIRDFQTIEMRGVEFAYPPSKKEAGFAVGPLDITIRRGEILFITGANGFGKSTILKMIAGLFPISAGTILVDGEPVADLAQYRSMFAGVFTDYHLFRKLYGVTALDDEARVVLGKLEVQTKVEVAHGTFSTVQLSSGQRKRLALAVALLEQRPILVLDEWAAEQDPFFRKTFYEEVLPWIRERGHTVVAVTHDDRYFGSADRTLMVEGGRLHEGRP